MPIERTLPTAEQMADSVARLSMLVLDLAYELHPKEENPWVEMAVRKDFFDRYGDCLEIWDLMKDNG